MDPRSRPYSKGYQEIGNGVWAYLQPDGGWGWSNAGLIVEGNEALLIDTLFDRALTAEMLAAMKEIVSPTCRITKVINTHANGDHCYGNALVAGAEIIASQATVEEMNELPPATLAALMKMTSDLGEAGKFLANIFSPFNFEGIELVAPTKTFNGYIQLDLGGRVVQLFEVGPAHTRGDSFVYLPDEAIVFTGDIVFNGGHPIAWTGPVSRWIAACDRILSLDHVDVVVPGHGPLTDLGAVASLKAYFKYLSDEARLRFEEGMTPLEAARDIDMSSYVNWGEPERVVVNVSTLYREFGADVASDPLTLFGYMAEFRRTG
ncbi:MAG: MBL fold metallo-hydrolase [Actinobacteria bacterium]|nr:MBL fold metallo-hydrolase [Actinomycetota bacterium]